jgi:hypothetical protein
MFYSQCFCVLVIFPMWNVFLCSTCVQLHPQFRNRDHFGEKDGNTGCLCWMIWLFSISSAVTIFPTLAMTYVLKDIDLQMQLLGTGGDTLIVTHGAPGSSASVHLILTSNVAFFNSFH